MKRVGSKHSAIIDVGGGESTLVDDLLGYGYRNITLLDISQTAIDVTRKRLGAASERVNWLVGNVTEVELGTATFDIWHDRAVFHFLATASERAGYVRQVGRAVRQGGYVIVSTFGPEGPTKCSGLDLVRAYHKALAESRAFVAGGPLELPETATTISVKEGKRHVQDGPYADAKEQLGGFTIVELPSLDAALEWEARCPAASYGAMEVRPLAPELRRRIVE